MSLIVEVANHGGDDWDGAYTDITDQVKIYEMRVGHNAHQGEVGTGSGFDLEDDAADVSLPVKRVVRIRETATSPDTILFRGRVAEKNVTRGGVLAGDARAFDVQLDDINADLRGIPIRKWVRPRESDYARLVALWKAYLKGNASSANYHRPSTRLVITRDGNPRWARNANRVTLPKQTYTDTDPAGILRDIAEAAAKEFFVTNRGEIFYDLPLSTKFAASLSITDDDPNMTTEFPPNHPASGDQDGSEFLSGVVVSYGKNKRIARYRPAVETAHDFWREVVPIDSTSADDARKRATATLQGQAREDVTVSVSIDLTASQVGMVRAGQTLSIRSAAAGILTPRVLRVGRLMWEPLAPGRYRAHMELGFPKKLVPRVRRGLGKNPGNRTASTGPEVQAGEPECPPMPDVINQSNTAAFDIFSGGGFVVDLVLPDGCDEAGLLLIVFAAWTNETMADIDGELTAAGFTHFLVTNQVVGTRASNVYYRVITGSEGWTGTGDTVPLTVADQTTLVAAAALLRDWASGPDWVINPGVTEEPDAIADTGWPEGTTVRYMVALVSDVYASISGTPTDGTDAFSLIGGGSVDAPSTALDISIMAHHFYSDQQSIDPTAYTCASPIISYTLAIRGDVCSSSTLIGEAGQVFGATPVTLA